MTDSEYTTNPSTEENALVTHPGSNSGKKAAQAFYKKLPFPSPWVLHFVVLSNLFALLLGLRNLIFLHDEQLRQQTLSGVMNQVGLLIVFVSAFYVKPRKIFHTVAFSIGFILVILGFIGVCSTYWMNKEAKVKIEAELTQLLKEKAASEAGGARMPYTYDPTNGLTSSGDIFRVKQ